MGFQRKYLIKYISLISYILKSCYNKTNSQILLKTIFHDLKYKILFGSEIHFKCVPDDILDELVTHCYDNKSILECSLQIHKCLFVSQDTLKKLNLCNMQWVLVNVKDSSSNCLPISHYNRIVVLDNFKEFGCLLTSTNLFNLTDCNFNSQPIMLRIIKPLIDYKPTITKNVSISVINSLFNVDAKIILDKVLYNYFSFQKFVSEGDIFKLDLNKYFSESNYLLNPQDSSIVYIKIILAKENNAQINLYNCKKSFYISNSHSNLNEIKLPINTFFPMEKQFAISDLKDININNYNDFILNVVPDGLHHVSKLFISSILPFIQQRYTDIDSIKPIFLVYGSNGSGKELLIKSLSQFFGIRYTSQCCFDLPSNNITQFKKKVENLFHNIRKMTPCLLHLKNIEVLSFTKDLEQELLEILIKEINIKSKKPIIIMATTNFKNDLSPVLLRLFLKVQQIDNLSKTNREQLLKWILKRDSVIIKNSTIKKIIDHTTGYNYMNYVTLLLIAAKNHLFTNNETKEIILNESEIMLAIDKINETFTKSLGTPKIQSVKLDDIGGLKNVKDEIISALNPSNINIKRSGILLYGPPGTGKTLLAKAIATECKYNFLSINGPELLNMYVGQSESNIREVFNKARSAVPCILFFDELDSLAPKRGSGSSGDRVVSQLLTELDSITNENQQIFVLGNTNRPDLIDSALIRPGRLDKKIFVGGCTDYDSKLQVLIALTKKFNLSPNVQLEKLIEHLPSQVTGAELYGICHNAWFNCARRFIQQRIKNKIDKVCDTLTVTEEDFMIALNTFFIQK